VIEGLFPFVSPGGWRRMFQQILQLQDGQVRFFGLCSILAGVLADVVLSWPGYGLRTFPVKSAF
jgi:uncharacterized protein YjeT (DUF2065 family)